jgi:putative Mg2+ transporter-C (MgtC) family protein
MISFPTLLLRLCLALLLGACIGVERQNQAQSAGLRTNTLVWAPASLRSSRPMGLTCS